MLRIHRSTNPSMHKKTLFSTSLLLVLLAGAFLWPSANAPSALAATFPLNGVVSTTTGVNLREQPSAASAIVAMMPINARAVVIGGPFNATWYWLDYNGTKAYANGNYLVLADDKFTPAPTTTPSPATTAETSSTPAPAT